MDNKNAKRLMGSREDETDDSEIKSLPLARVRLVLAKSAAPQQKRSNYARLISSLSSRD
jgi:hypothetical protein